MADNQWIMCSERTPEPQPGPGQGGWDSESRDSRPVLLAVWPLAVLDGDVVVDRQGEPQVEEAWFRQPATADPDGDPYDLSDEDEAWDARGGWFGDLVGEWSGEADYTQRAIAWQPFPSTAELREP